MGSTYSTLNTTAFDNCTQWNSRNYPGLKGGSVHIQKGSQLTAINSTLANTTTEICVLGFNSMRNVQQTDINTSGLINGEPAETTEQLFLNNSTLANAIVGSGYLEHSTVTDSTLSVFVLKNSSFNAVQSGLTIGENSTAIDVNSDNFVITNSKAKNITAENILIENKGKGAMSVQDFNCPNGLSLQSNVAEDIALSGKETESCTFEFGITDAPTAAPTPSPTLAPTLAVTRSPVFSSEPTPAPSASSAASSHKVTLTAMLATMAVINMMR
ncbi:MAG: hypothetical protein V4629_00365 [Pseudomonadota bacterium]